MDDFRRDMMRARLIDRVVAASRERPGEVIMMPPMGIDVTTGRPIWAGLGALVPAPALDPWEATFAPRLLDRGDSARRPLLIGNGMGATVCREAMPVDAEGGIAAPWGRASVPRARRIEDPRWTRALPWRGWMKGLFGPRAFVAAGGLALVNVVLPLLVLRLVVGRRRAFRMWALMVVPVAAVVLLLFTVSAAELLHLFCSCVRSCLVWWVFFAVVRRGVVAMAGS